MSNFKRREIVDFINRQKLGTTEAEEAVARIREQFSGITIDEIESAFAVYDDEVDARFAEHQAQYIRSKDQSREARLIFEGCPADITFDEAVTFKAQQGDPVALRWQASWNTKEYRRMEALSLAALAAHPQFVEKPDGVFEWIGEGDMPSENQMIDWFQLNHPSRAREIENAIDQAGDE
jgi:hypothetical protein